MGRSGKTQRSRDYWIGEVFFSEGHAWGVDEQLDTIWLGAEEDILLVIEGDKALPDTLSPKQGTTLIQL
ncbi:unnamed protein product, partial [marine sediment metagenome]